MAKHTFHLSPQASTPLYNYVSSPLIRLILLSLTLLDILLFSIGLGLAKKYIPTDGGWQDTAADSNFGEELGLGIMFFPFIWLLFLLLWNLLKKPKIHPGYYIGFDLYVATSMIVGLSMAVVFSSIWQDRDDGCGLSTESNPEFAICVRHFQPIKNLDIVAYALGLVISIPLLVLFGLACRVCHVYDREKAAMKLLHQRNLELESPRGSSSTERIVPSPKDSSLGPSGEDTILESHVV